MMRIQGQGGINFNANQGMFGGHSSMGASFASTITVTPNIIAGQDAIKLWTTEAGIYGLPSKCAVKASPDTPCEALYAALLNFAHTECKNASDGLAGQFHGMGAFAPRHEMKISWTPTIETIRFEGDALPRDSTPIGQLLRDGEPFQASGKLNQTVDKSNQKALGALAGIKPEDKKYAVADAMFKDLDSDGSGAIDPTELVVYLMNRGEPPSSVQALFARLDTNADGKVTKEEWRAGWLAGTVTKTDKGCCVVS
uniref:EF-hand domain-containing protein n=1 Tax=Calcidiscus leptoporus TaxID=127549 RepID=A0A7S0NNC1_9EUKA|mmetsp:Transcript_12108/g.28086  ORF Transcript_12108/g.28086 Transcript_12108/m.28086 type:complete len:254 (+) Transcript_12108:88-849(+)